MKKKRILVTGGAGFVGSNLCERLLSEGHRVIAADNFFTGDRDNIERLRSHPGFELFRHDITIPFIRETDQIYHLACPSAPVHYMHEPVTTLKASLIGTTNILEMARRTQARVVFASSSKVYGYVAESPIEERNWGRVNPVGNKSPYEEGKRAAEALCAAYFRQYGTDARIARLFNVYGPHMSAFDGRVVSNFIMSALKGENITIRSNGNQTRCFLYVDDAVDALVRLMETPGDQKSYPVNIGSDRKVRIEALAEMIVKLTGSRSRIVRLNLSRESPSDYTPNIRYAREAYDWQPSVSIEQGLVRTIRYFEEKLRRESRVYPGMTWVEML